MNNAEKIVEAAKKLLGKEMDSAHFISEVFKNAGLSFERLRTVERDSNSTDSTERVTSAPGDVALILEGNAVPEYYNPGIVIGGSMIIYADNRLKRVLEVSAITLAIEKIRIVGIRRVMLS